MFGFGQSKNIIEVKFYEGESKTPFIVSNMPIEQLPDTFDIDTILNIDDQEWLIVDARPAEKTAFKESGKLDIYVIKKVVTSVDPNEILFSLPTIDNELPGVENVSSLENIIVFLEDDWRQFEFVEQKHEHLIKEEFNQIVNIYNHHREGAGFKEIHVRQKITQPIEDAGLTLSILESAFDIEKKYNGVAFNTYAATLINGFAFQTRSGWVLWGQLNNSGAVSTLNLSQTEGAEVKAIADQIDSFTDEYNLYLIDWPRLFWSGKKKASFSDYDIVDHI